MIRIDCVGLSVKSGSKILVNDVSFSALPGQILAVLGTAGAGKSTLITAVRGAHPRVRGTVTTGEVFYNGLLLYKHLDAFRSSIGFVPQDDILETRLTVRSLLEYEAVLRLPDDFAASKIDSRIDEVLSLLVLSNIQNSPITVLSGGQKRRLSIAVELLNDPDILFLDEPHRGLDPTSVRILNQLLKSLANRGKTLIVITHEAEYAHQCDQVMFLAPGGNLAYIGAPQNALIYFHKPTLQGVYDTLSHSDSGESLGRAFAATQQRVSSPSPGQPPEIVRHGWLRQSLILIRRESDLLAPFAGSVGTARLFAPARSMGRLAGLLAAPVILAVVTNLGKSAECLNNKILDADVVQQAPQLLAHLIFIAMILGAVPAAYEIVKGVNLYERARLTYLSITSFVFSKVFILGGIALVQCAVLLATVHLLIPLHHTSLTVLQIYFILAATELSAILIGLLVSSLVRESETALLIVAVVIIPQLVLTGLNPQLENLEGLALRLTEITPTRWGVGALGNLFDLNDRFRAAHIPGNGKIFDTSVFDAAKALCVTITFLSGCILVALRAKEPKRRYGDAPKKKQNSGSPLTRIYARFVGIYDQLIQDKRRWIWGGVITAALMIVLIAIPSGRRIIDRIKRTPTPTPEPTQTPVLPPTVLLRLSLDSSQQGFVLSSEYPLNLLESGQIWKSNQQGDNVFCKPKKYPVIVKLLANGAGKFFLQRPDNETLNPGWGVTEYKNLAHGRTIETKIGTNKRRAIYFRAVGQPWIYLGTVSVGNAPEAEGAR